MTSRERAILSAAFVTQAVAIGATMGAYSLFVKPIGDEFGASRMQMSLGISFMTLMLGVTGISIGGLLDRTSIRRVMLIGTLWLSVSLLLLSQAQALWQLGAFALLIGAGIPALGPLASSVLVSKEFLATRGRALGIANMGVPVGGFVFALLAGQLLGRIGWRGTLVTFAGMVAVLSTGLILYGVPAHVAPTPDEDDGAADDASAERWTPARLFRTRDFLAAAGCFGVAVGSNAGWGAHLAAYLLEAGASTELAAALVACGVGGGLIGGLGFGTLADRYNPRSLLFVTVGVQGLCFAILWSAPGLVAVSAAAVMAGVIGGAFLPVFVSLLAGRFGTETLGQAAGLSNVFILPFGFGVPIAVGALRDAGGNYELSLLLILGLILTSGLSLSLFQGLARPAIADAASAN